MEEALTILFAANQSPSAQLPVSAALISPLRDRWNDFGFRTMFEFMFRNAKGQSLSGHVKLAFLTPEGDQHPKDSEEVILSALSRAKKPSLEAKNMPTFFSLQSQLEDYRKLVRELGSHEAENFLIAINDLVAAQRSSPRPGWFRKAVASEAFSLSFIRNADAAFAYYNAASILDGLEFERIGAISQSMSLNFKLDTFQGAHSIMLSFDNASILPKRIVALIGRNGIGKSQALHNLVSSALADDPRLRTTDNSRPQINRIIAIGTPGETNRTFPARRRRARIPYERVALRRAGAQRGIFGIGSLVVQLFRSSQSIGRYSRWRLFQEAVQPVVPIEELAFRSRFGPKDVSGPLVYLSELGVGGEQSTLQTFHRIDPLADPVRVVAPGHDFPLSSGQLSFMAFAAQICLAIENGSLLLIDEPETHLHPNLISRLVVVLDRILSLTGSLAVVATHSLHLVRELPRSQVQVMFEARRGIPQVATPRLKTFGADIESISEFVFGETAAEQLEELRRRIGESSMDADHVLESLKDELPSEALMKLARELANQSQKF